LEFLFALFMLPIALLIFVAYVVALVDAAKRDKWFWFVLMLLCGPIAFFYFIFSFGRGGNSRRHYARRY